MEPGSIFTADVNCKTLNKLRNAIQTSFVRYNHHDHVRFHTAVLTKEEIRDFHWKLFNNPSYSPDLAYCDYSSFWHLKQWLCVYWFEKDEELKTDVDTLLNFQVANFFAEGLRKLNSATNSTKNRITSMLKSEVNI